MNSIQATFSQEIVPLVKQKGYSLTLLQQTMQPLDRHYMSVQWTNWFTYWTNVTPLRDILIIVIIHFLKTIMITLLPGSSYFSNNFLSR